MADKCIITYENETRGHGPFPRDDAEEILKKKGYRFIGGSDSCSRWKTPSNQVARLKQLH